MFLIGYLSAAAGVCTAAVTAVTAYKGQNKQSEQNQPQSLVLKDLANASHILFSFSFVVFGILTRGGTAFAVPDTIL